MSRGDGLTTRSGSRRATLALLVVAAATLLSSCGPSADDAPVVIVQRPDASVEILVPVCAGDAMRRVNVQHEHVDITWWFSQETRQRAVASGIATIAIGPDGLDLADQFEGVFVTASDEGEAITAPFSSLRVVDIWTEQTEAYVYVPWTRADAAAQYYMVTIPFREERVVAEPVTEDGGKALLGMFCDRRAG